MGVKGKYELNENKSRWRMKKAITVREGGAVLFLIQTTFVSAFNLSTIQVMLHY